MPIQPSIVKPYWRSMCGNAEIYCGDCWDVFSIIGNVDAVITDPPYGIADTHDGHLSNVVLKKREPARQVLGFEGINERECVDLVARLVRESRGWVVLTCEWKFMNALDVAGLLVRFGIWRKRDGAPQFTGDRPGTGWEGVAICHGVGLKQWNGGGKHAFWDYPKGQNKSGHPTGKPLGLFEQFVLDFTQPYNVILDPFMGSGTTGVACAIHQRRFVGVEKEQRWCDIAAERIQLELIKQGAKPPTKGSHIGPPPSRGIIRRG